MFAQLNGGVGLHDLSGKREGSLKGKAVSGVPSECEQSKENIPSSGSQRNSCTRFSGDSTTSSEHTLCDGISTPAFYQEVAKASGQWASETLCDVSTLSANMRSMRLQSGDSSSWLQGFEDHPEIKQKHNSIDLPTSPLSPAICVDLMESPGSVIHKRSEKQGNIDDDLLRHARTMGEVLDESAMGAAW